MNVVTYIYIDKQKIYQVLIQNYRRIGISNSTSTLLSFVKNHSELKNITIWDGESEIKLGGNYYNQKNKRYYYYGKTLSPQLFMVDLTDYILHKLDSTLENTSICINHYYGKRVE